jgi:hypothetical protein
VLAPGQEQLLRRMLDPPEGLPEGWHFERFDIAPDRVEARYRRGSELAEVRFVQDGQLTIAGRDQLPEDLVQALEVSALARAHRIVWLPPGPERRALPSSIDPKWVALEAGVLPALRISTPPRQVQATRERYEALGASVVRLELDASQSSTEQAILYVAKHASDAARVAELERRLLLEARRVHQRRGLAEEIGWALGYPSCCVSAFAERAHPGVLAVVGSLVSGRVGSDAYRAARDAWVPAPEPRLNGFLRRTRRSLIGFQPCRYDCRAALHHADRVADACARIDPDWLADTDARLAAPVVIAPNGALSLVHIERRIEPMRIVGARPLREQNRDPSAADSELAPVLIGAEVHDDGFLAGAGTAWCLLVDFGARAPVIPPGARAFLER